MRKHVLNIAGTPLVAGELLGEMQQAKQRLIKLGCRGILE
jgi:hypothetical protein